MTSQIDYDPDFLDDEIELPAEPAMPRPKAKALVVEDDPELAHVCVHRLARLGMSAEVVWTHDDAVAALSRKGDELAFVYVDSRLFCGTYASAASQIRALRPSTPFVVATNSIDDVLLSDGVAILKQFSEDEFQAAFDTALFDDDSRRVLLEAAETVHELDSLQPQAPVAETVPAAEPELQLAT